MITIYKNAYHVGWDTTGVGLVRSGSSGGGISETDLSNYYTKEQLNLSGLSSVHFDNITEAYHNNLLGLEGGSIADNSSGESSGEAGEYYHLSLYDYSRLTMLNFSMSLSEDVDNIVTLVNDQSSPGNSKYYGTNVEGTKGWFGLPEGGSSGGGGETLWEIDSNGYLTPIDSGSTVLIESAIIGYSDESRWGNIYILLLLWYRCI